MAPGRLTPRTPPGPADQAAEPPPGPGRQPGAGPRTGGGAKTGGGEGPGWRAPGAPPRPGREPLSPATRDRLRRALLALAADALSGPGGLAARLRGALDGAPLSTVSLPLDIGAAT